jgi:sugar diacid utilization regulator
MARALRRPAAGAELAVELPDGRWLSAREVRAGRDRLGWFCLVTGTPPEPAVVLGVGEAALCCALSELEQRAAEAALSETREQILWDLLESAPDHRRAAVVRAARLHIALSGPQRVLHGVADEVDGIARAESWEASALERIRRDLVNMVRRVVTGHAAGELVAGRGDMVVAVVSCRDRAAVRRLLRALRSEAARIVPGGIAWGVGGPRDDPSDLWSAHREAKLAVRAARRLGGDRVALHEDLGMVRLLLASDPEPDLAAFVEEVIGPLVEHDRHHDGELRRTLRAYFDADCSQQEAARRLYVHHKTLRYRLDRIEALTSLDLRRHEDRVRADLALKILEVAELQTFDASDP